MTKLEYAKQEMLKNTLICDVVERYITHQFCPSQFGLEDMDCASVYTANLCSECWKKETGE